jgi:hypothetical protein
MRKVGSVLEGHDRQALVPLPQEEGPASFDLPAREIGRSESKPELEGYLKRAEAESDRKLREQRKKDILRRIEELNGRNPQRGGAGREAAFRGNSSLEKIQEESREEAVRGLQRELKRKNDRIKELELQLRRKEEECGQLERAGLEFRRVLELVLKRRGDRVD